MFSLNHEEEKYFASSALSFVVPSSFFWFSYDRRIALVNLSTAGILVECENYFIPVVEAPLNRLFILGFLLNLL